MNDAQTMEARRGRPTTTYGSEFVDGAIRKLSGTVSAAPVVESRDDEGQGDGALVRSLVQVLDYFGHTVDEMSVAMAARGAAPEALIRGICEKHGIHVRQIELKADDFGALWGPVLAFLDGEAVVLVPGLWRRWSPITGGSSMRKRILRDGLHTTGFTFYRGLSSGRLSERELWRAMFGRENKRDLLHAVTWGIVAAGLGATSISLLGSMVEWALPEGDRRSLGLLAAGWCAVAFTASSMRLSRVLLQSRIGTRAGVSTEAALVGRALSLPMTAFKGMGAGDLAERIRDACQFGRSIYGTATDLVLALISVLAYGALLAVTSWRAVLAVGALMLVRGVVSAALLYRMYVAGQRQCAARGKMSGRLFEMLSGIARIKVASAEPRAFYQWATAFATARRAAYSSSLSWATLVASEGLFDVFGTVALYFVCCSTGGGGAAVSAGAFVVANACLGSWQAAYSDLVGGLMTLLPMIPKTERIRPLLSELPEVTAGATATHLEGNVSLRHVTFHYAEDDVRVLDHLSLDIKRGEFVAIVGPSGCGKSTLIRILLGFYAPTSGSVLLDGKELDSLDLRSVRSQIGAVLQGSELLPSSIFFNIAGTSKKTMEEAWTAARRACIAEDIEKMPMKMHTMISDRAVTISGGQKQRILIARALVREPKLVIFDEATSALDNNTQASVMGALATLDCTKICIAHRLSTVMNADRIIVMDKGTIVQEGTFESLMNEEGLFRSLAQRQLETDDARSHSTED